MKILSVVGARPQFIKAAAVSRVLLGRLGVEEQILHTGQHYDENLSEVFFRELEIPCPAFLLDIGSASHGKQTGQMLAGIEEILVQERPDVVLVYGDTNSTLSGALAAVKLHVPVAHVEAGLRSFNRQMPEEHNRVVADHVSDLLFAPTEVSVANLLREGIAPGRIHQCGDVMSDVAQFFAAKAEATSHILRDLTLRPQSYALTTIHRAENTDHPSRMENIVQALLQLNSTCSVVLPLHPRTRAALNSTGLYDQLARKIKVIEPVGYLDMVMLEKNAQLIVTDSGGVQKEAYFHKTPCVTLRDETEWVELLETGWNRLASPDNSALMIEAFAEAFRNPAGRRDDLYGDGKSAEKIVDVLMRYGPQ